MGFSVIHSFAGKNAILDGIGIFFAEYLAYILVVIFALVLLTQKDWRRRIQLILFSAVSLVVSYGIIEHALNYFFPSARPFVEFDFTPLIAHAADASFPSGTATIFFTLASLMFFWIDRRRGVWFFVGAVLIGLARVFVGVHYPLDIAGGAVIGFITPFLLRYFVPSLSPFPKGSTASGREGFLN